MKKMFFTLILFTISINLFAQTKIEANREKFDPAKDPFKDLQTVVVQAKLENKRILLDIGGEWCIWCHRLDAFIESNQEIKDALHKNFISLKINVSKENENKTFLAQFPKVPGYPHIFVLDEDGKLLHSQDTSQLEKEKSYSKEKILEFLNTWATKKSL